jgi:hypothetical protein
VAPRRRGGRKWTDLAPSYRARLEGAGISREDWLSGKDLRAARSHRPAPPTWQAPKDAIRRTLDGTDTEADRADLARWSERERPAWLAAPFGISTETAAALSQIGSAPKDWGHVEIVARRFENWTMTVTPRAHVTPGGVVRTHAYDIKVTIPGDQGGIEVLDLLEDRGVDFTVGS